MHGFISALQMSSNASRGTWAPGLLRRMQSLAMQACCRPARSRSLLWQRPPGGTPVWTAAKPRSQPLRHFRGLDFGGQAAAGAG